MSIARSIHRNIEHLLDSLTMYRTVVYALFALAGIAMALSLLGYISYSALNMVASLAILIPVSYGSSRLFAYTFRTTHNPESWLITALILFFLVLPPTSLKAAVSLAMIALLATASKYFLAVRGRHLFNPAAVAVAISGFVGLGYASWWVSMPPLLPAIIILGGLIVWKTRRFAMVGTFIAVSMATVIVIAIFHHGNAISMLGTAIKSYPLLFLASVMVTEPLTAPTTRRWQLVYAVFVGILAHAQLASWLSPEVALVFGNVITFATSQKRQLCFSLISIVPISKRSYEVTLRPADAINWQPGQYIELNLPHAKTDARGTRRMFSIASIPSEGIVRLGITTSQRVSSFKQALLTLPPGSQLSATLIAGDFILDSSEKPLLFLAGGIGITPFRAMIESLVALQSKRTTRLLYFARSNDAFVWQDFFTASTGTIPLTTIPIITEQIASWPGASGVISPALLQQYAPNLLDCVVYISGPPSFVERAVSELLKLGVQRRHVKTDYFSGY